MSTMKQERQLFQNERKATVKRWLESMSSKTVINTHKALREAVKWDLAQHEADDRLWLVTDLPQVVKYMQDVTFKQNKL